MGVDYQDPREDYFDLLKTYQGMSEENLRREIRAIANLSDIHDEIETTAGMELETAAMQQALEEKQQLEETPNA